MKYLLLLALLFAAACPVPPVILDERDAGFDPFDDAGAPENDSGPVPTCDNAELGVLPPADRDRLVLVAHPFGDGTEIRALIVRSDGALLETGERLDVGFEVSQLAFAPSGEFAVAIAEDGRAASIETKSAETLGVVDTAQLPDFGSSDLRFNAAGDRVYVASANVTEEAGVDALSLDCDGSLNLVEGSHYGLRLAGTLALLPGSRAVVFGGQAVFEPIDDDDVRLVRLDGEAFQEVASFDLYTDFIDALRISANDDGSFVALPNGSPFSAEGGQVIVAAIDGDTLSLDTRVLNMGDAREAIFTPAGDIAVTRLEPGIVSLLSNAGGDWAEVDSESGVGLAEHIAFVKRGALTGLGLVTSVGQVGQIVVVETAPGTILRIATAPLGEGAENIPGAIAIQE